MIETLLSAAVGWGFSKTADALISEARNFNGINTGFLNHSPQFCNEAYHAEPRLGGYLPYLELMDFGPTILSDTTPRIEVEVSTKEFFTGGRNLDWAVLRAQAYAAYREAGHATKDSSVVRVSGIEKTQGGIRMKLQPTRYFCQAESNLVLDYEAYVSFEKNMKRRRTASLRSMLSAEKPGYLPDISDDRLANSLGVSICLLSNDKHGATMLRMVNRVKDVGVFPSGVHPAMSCSIEWADTVETSDLLSFIMDDVEYEMLQETGLVRGEYEPPTMLSLCREFLRGGKPQLFLLSYTDLPQDELNHRRDEQIKKNKLYRPEKIEMKGSSIFRNNDSSMSVSGRSNLQFTHEGAASLFLVNRLLSKIF